MAAPAETGTPNMHRAKQSLIEECGRKGGDSGDAARKKQHDQQRPKRIHLTLTGLLMEGVIATMRYLSPDSRVNHGHRRFSPARLRCSGQPVRKI
jgi:hypothetical protein